MSSIKIVLTYVHPPIPHRGSDWHAALDGYEPGDVYGEGESILAALGMLLANLEDSKCDCENMGVGMGHTDECAWRRWNYRGLPPAKRAEGLEAKRSSIQEVEKEE